MSDTSKGFDVDSYNKPNFNFDAAFNEGYGTAIVKLGGNNLSGNQPYRMNGYPDFANKQARFPIRGAYWVTGGGNPYAAAVFYAQNRAPWTNFDLLDNETLDSGNPWNDAQACIFFDTLASFRLPGYNPWQYGSRDSLWKSWGPWPGLQARKVLALIALYNGAPLQNIGTNYDGALTKGHQWSSSATIGGSGNIDANAFTPDAFAAPIPEVPHTMYSLVPGTDGNAYVVSLITGIRAAINSPYHYDLLDRVKKNDGHDTMYPGEIDIVKGYLTAINPPSTSSSVSITDAQIAAFSDQTASKIHIPTTLELSGTISGKATQS